MIPLSTPSHIFVECGPLDFGVVAARAGKLCCGVCTFACRKHTSVVQDAVDKGDEVITDLQWLLENTEEVQVALPSIVTSNTFGLESMNPPLTNCPTCSSVMTRQSLTATLHTSTGSNNISGWFVKITNTTNIKLVSLRFLKLMNFLFGVFTCVICTYEKLVFSCNA